MMFVVLAENDMSPEHVARRKALMDAHKEYLLKNLARIPTAGPLRESLEAETIGGMWLVKAENKAEVEALLREDPFFPTRKDCKILHWAKALPEMATI